MASSTAANFQPSLPNNLPTIPVKLDGTNYYLWKSIMMSLLQSYNLLDYADGTKTAPAATISEKQGTETVEAPNHVLVESTTCRSTRRSSVSGGAPPTHGAPRGPSSSPPSVQLASMAQQQALNPFAPYQSQPQPMFPQQQRPLVASSNPFGDAGFSAFPQNPVVHHPQSGNPFGSSGLL